MSRYSEYEYRKQPVSDMNSFEGSYQAITMNTLVIHCFNTHTTKIPQAVTSYFRYEVYPSENILDNNGNPVESTQTLSVETNAVGRAAFALSSSRPWIIYSTFKVLSFTTHSTHDDSHPQPLIQEIHDLHHAVISTMFDLYSLAILDFEKSIKYDVE